MAISFISVVSFGYTDAGNPKNNTTNPVSESVATGSGAEFALLDVSFRASQGPVSSTPSLGGNNFTLIRRTNTASGSDDYDIETWGLVGSDIPTGTNTLSMGFDADTDPAVVRVSFWSGNDTTDVATATNYHDEEVNTINAPDIELNGTGSDTFGTSGNALIAIGCYRGSDAGTVTYTNSFTERNEKLSGGGSNTNDITTWLASLESGLPSNTVIDYAGNDESTGQLIELVAAAAGGSENSYYYQANQ